MNKLENWMNNLKEPALRQALRFLLNSKDKNLLHVHKMFIEQQIHEFNRMYCEV